MTHQHAEAFCVMTYRSKDGEEERVWNSRDGVTPFLITLRSGKEATHVEWERDVYCPEHPKHMIPGDRYFTDLDPETALALAWKMVDRNWDHPDYPMSARWGNKEDAAKDMAESYLKNPGEPTIKEMLG